MHKIGPSFKRKVDFFFGGGEAIAPLTLPGKIDEHIPFRMVLIIFKKSRANRLEFD